MNEIQVVLLGPLRAPFEAWLDSRGLYLFPIPTSAHDQMYPSDDLPSFGIGIKDEQAGQG